MYYLGSTGPGIKIGFIVLYSFIPPFNTVTFRSNQPANQKKIVIIIYLNKN